MNVIGIRVEPSAVTFVVFDVDQNTIINSEKIKIPKALIVPEKLKFIRVNLLDVLREYKIQKAGIRITESNAQTIKVERIQIEGVIIETFASSTLQNYFCGQISSISKLLGIERIDFKKYLDGTLNYDVVENWNNFSTIEKEACFAAIGAAHV